MESSELFMEKRKRTHMLTFFCGTSSFCLLVVVAIQNWLFFFLKPLKFTHKPLELSNI